MNRVLALFAAPRADKPEATEFLRTLAALRALDHPVELAEVGRGIGVLSNGPALTPDGERYLAALAEDGVVPQPELDLSEAVSIAFALLRLPDPGRSAAPPVLRLVRGRTLDEAAHQALASAGQVVLDPPA